MPLVLIHSVEVETCGPLAQPRRYRGEGSRVAHDDVDGVHVVQGGVDWIPDVVAGGGSRG